MKAKSYQTRGLKSGTFTKAFLKLFGIFMAAIYLGVVLQLPVWLTTALSLGIIILIAYRMTAKTTFVVDELGIHQYLHYDKSAGHSSTQKSYAWDQIEWYQDGSELGRNGSEYHYLNIKFKDGTKFSITSQHGERHDFFALSEAFLENVQNRPSSDVLSKEIPALSSKGAAKIRRKKSFYETRFAKALSLFFLLFTLAIVFVVFSMYEQPKMTHLFRIFIVLIPGTAYMIYRSFGKK